MGRFVDWVVMFRLAPTWPAAALPPSVLNTVHAMGWGGVVRFPGADAAQRARAGAAENLAGAH
jgi:hypothetical protein